MAGFYATKLGIFKEVETSPDPNAQSSPQEQPTADQEQQATKNQNNEDTSKQDAQPQEQNDDNTEANENQDQQHQLEEDPTADTIPNDGQSDMNYNDGGGDQQPPQGDLNDNQDPSPVDDIKKKEEEIYADLTPEELDIKHKELKAQYLVMFDTTTRLVQRINNISLNPEIIPVIEYVSNNLSKLRTMLVDYMESVYKTKSYTENYVNYNRFLATLNGISKILEEINKNED